MLLDCKIQQWWVVASFIEKKILIVVCGSGDNADVEIASYEGGALATDLKLEGFGLASSHYIGGVEAKELKLV